MTERYSRPNASRALMLKHDHHLAAPTFYDIYCRPRVLLLHGNASPLFVGGVGEICSVSETVGVDIVVDVVLVLRGAIDGFMRRQGLRGRAQGFATYQVVPFLDSTPAC